MSYEGNNRAKRELAPTRTGREHAAAYAILKHHNLNHHDDYHRTIHERDFFKSLANRKMCFSIGIYSCPMHPIHLVGLHHYTSGFPMENKGIRLDSGRQYWAT